MLFKKAESSTAAFKASTFGFQGSGKTHTACLIAQGLWKWADLKKPVAFFDTETGSDFWIERFREVGIELLVSKERAFTSLLDGIREMEGEASILIIDSITHVWNDLLSSYLKKVCRKRLQFQDWGPIKDTWRQYTDLFVNSPLHIIVCGRAGFTYDYDRNEEGEKELIKTGTKIKAETEFGFEPSLVFEMELAPPILAENDTRPRHKVKKSEWDHVCTILKDRTDQINGKQFRNPVFEDFLPHITKLNMGGVHFGVNTSTDSTALFEAGSGQTDWQKEMKQKEIMLEEFEGLLLKYFPGQTASEKRWKADIVEWAFQTRSWTKVHEMKLPEVEAGLKLTTDLLSNYTGQDTLNNLLISIAEKMKNGIPQA